MSVNRNGLMASCAVALTGADNSNIFVRVSREGDVLIDGTLTVGGDVLVGDDLTVAQTIECREMTIQGQNNAPAQSYLSGITFNVNNVAAGRVNCDGTNTILQGLQGVAGTVQTKCGTVISSTIVKDASNNIIFKVGGPAAPDTRLVRQTNSGDELYVPSLMQNLSGIANGSVVSFTNTAERMTGVGASFTAPYTGYYQLMGQFRSSAIGSFDAGTDVITFYADVSGGALTPLVGSIIDITSVNATSFETTISGYVRATAGEIINIMHVDTGTFTITDGVLFNIWKYMGPGDGLV